MARLRWLSLMFLSGVAVLGPLLPEVRAGPPNPAPASDWVGSETLSGYGRLRFQFPSSGRVTMIDARSTIAGTATISGGSVRLTFFSGQVVYTGTLKGDTMSGTASNGRTTWSWTVTRQGGAAGSGGESARITYDNSAKPQKLAPLRLKKQATVPLSPTAAAQRNWRKPADEAAKNLARDKELADALRQAANGSRLLNEQALRAIVAIESGANRNTGKNRYGYAGLFQMGPKPAKEAGYSYESVSDPKQWRTNVVAGVRYLEINAGRLLKYGVDVTPFNVYLAHQQGAWGARNILRGIQNGTAAQTAANRNELNNLPPGVVKRITASGRRVTVQDYYDYWSASFRAVYDRVNPPTPSPPAVP